MGFEDTQVHFAETRDGGGAGAALPVWGHFMQMVRKDPSLYKYYNKEAFDIPVGFDASLINEGHVIEDGAEEAPVDQVVIDQQEFDDEKEIYGFE